MVATLPRSMASAGVLGALLVAAAAAPHLAHTHAARHAHPPKTPLAPACRREGTVARFQVNAL